MATNEARYREAERRLWASVGVAPTERRLPLEHLGLSVRVQEVGDGPTVLFVHGATNSGSSWADLVKDLDGFRCVLLDRPGCGLSDPVPRPFTDVAALQAFADVLIPDVLDALGAARASVVATSFGSWFSLRAAAAHPDRIDRMVLFSYPLGAPMPHAPMVMRLATLPVLAGLTASIPPTERAVRMLLRQIGLRDALASGKFSRVHVDTFLALLRDTDTMRNEVRAGPRVFTVRDGLHPEMLHTPALLAQVAAPTSFLWGREDPMGGEAVARPFVAQLPNAELEMISGGHAVWIDQPERAAALTTEFLSR